MKKYILAALVLTILIPCLGSCSDISHTDTDVDVLYEEISRLELLLDERTSDLEMEIEALESENDWLQSEITSLEWELFEANRRAEAAEDYSAELEEILTDNGIEIEESHGEAKITKDK